MNRMLPAALRAGDLPLIAVLLLLSLVPGWSGSPGSRGARGLSVTIRHGDEQYRYPLDRPRLIEIRGRDGIFIVRITNSTAAVIKSGCRSGFCLRMGPVSRAGEAIHCIPQRIAIVVAGGDPQFDAVSQ